MKDGLSCSEIKKVRSNQLNKLTTLAICLLPILCIYRALGIFMLGEVVLIVLFFLNVFLNKNVNFIINKKQEAFIVFAIAICLISSVGYLGSFNNLVVFPRLIRLLFCLFMACFLGGYCFDYKQAKKYIMAIAVVATTVILFQKLYNEITGEYMLFLAKKYIYSSNVYNDYYFSVIQSSSTYRPSSIFLEPSHYCQYALFALGLALFEKKFFIKNITVAIVFTLGIFISTSSTGVIIACLLWGLYILEHAKDYIIGKKIKPSTIVAAVVVVGVVAFIFIKFSDTLYAIRRVSNSSSPAVKARLGSFGVFVEDSGLLKFFFGEGYGVVKDGVWYASIPYYFNGTGWLGMIAVIALFVSLFIESNKFQKKLLLIFFILCFVTEVLTNYWLVFIIPLVMFAKEDDEVLKNEKRICNISAVL